MDHKIKKIKSFSYNDFLNEVVKIDVNCSIQKNNIKVKTTKNKHAIEAFFTFDLNSNKPDTVIGSYKITFHENDPELSKIQEGKFQGMINPHWIEIKPLEYASNPNWKLHFQN